MTERPRIAGKSRILIVDDHPVVRQGIARMIEQELDLMVCGEAESGEEAMQAVAESNPTLVLMDLSLRGTTALDVIKNIRASHPDLPVLVLSMHDEALWAERVLRAGACGFVMKQEKPRVLMSKIREAVNGGLCLSDRMADRLLRKFTGQTRGTPHANVDGLGDRELEVLQLLAQGMSSRDIAGSMQISVKTVEAHRENLKRKLGLASSAELLRYAVIRFLGE